jgi:hypothetical protein
MRSEQAEKLDARVAGAADDADLDHRFLARLAIRGEARF